MKSSLPVSRSGALRSPLALCLATIPLGVVCALHLAGHSALALLLALLLVEALLCAAGATWFVRRRLLAIADALERQADGDPDASIPAGDGDLSKRLHDAVQALTDSEVRVRSIVNAVADGILTFDDSGGLLSANRAAVRMFGVAMDEMIGKPLMQFIPLSAAEESALRNVASGESRNLGARRRLEGQRSKGGFFPLELAVSRVRLKGKLVYIGLVHDLTHRQQAEDVQHLQALTFASSSDGLLLTDLDGRIIDWNPASERMFGYSRVEALGQTAGLITGTKEPADLTSQALEEIRATGRWMGEVRFRRKDGRQGLCEMTILPMQDEHGRFLATLRVSRDVTERRRMEQFQAVKQAVTRNLAESASVSEAVTLLLQRMGDCFGFEVGCWWAVDSAAGVLRCPEARQRTGSQVEEFLALSQQLTFPPGEGLPGRCWAERRAFAGIAAEVVPRRAEVAARVGLQSAVAFPVVLGNEVHGVFEFLSRQRQAPDEGLLRLLGDVGSQVGQFVERKRVEGQLRLMQSVVVQARDAVIVTEAEPLDEPGPRIVFVNEAFTRMTGYRPEEVMGRSPRLLHGPQTLGPVLERLEKALRNWEPIQVELIHYRKDGLPFWFDLSIVPLADETGWFTHFIALGRDVSERKQAEHAIRESEAKLSALIENTTDAIWSVDRQYRLVTFNTATNEGYRRGYGRDLALGQHVADTVPAAEAPFWIELYDRALSGERFSTEYATAQGFFELSLNPIVNAGEITGVSIFLRDINMRKRVEEELKQRAKRRSRPAGPRATSWPTSATRFARR